MRTIAIAAVAALAFLQAASAFLAPVPAQTRAPLGVRGRGTKMMLSPLDITQSLVAYSKDYDVFTKNQGDYSWGSVAAPDWVLPVASIAILSLGVIVPLILKPGVDAFNSGGVKGTETKAAASGKAVPTKAGAKPAARVAASPAKAAGGKAVAKKGAVPAAPAAPKKKGWF